jgi:SanA protein
MKKEITSEPAPAALRFLFIVSLWLITGVVIVFLFILPQRLNGALDTLHQVKASITSLFRFCDDWNFLLLTILFSFSVIIYALNDRLLKKYLPNGERGFYSEGAIWALRNMANLVLYFFETGLFCLILTHSVTTPSIYSSLDELPKTKYHILLLGTSKYIDPQGKRQYENLYYKARIASVVELYKSGRVKSVLISGDRHGAYNEPEDMKKDLVKAGISAKLISEDFDGFRTFDSIIRMRQQLKGNETILIVSQYFHLERAIYLARQKGMEAEGYAAKGSMTLSMIQREFLAKPRIILDIYLLNIQVSGVAAHPRRKVSFTKTGDLFILFVVAGSIVVAGRMTRGLLEF